MAETDSLFDGIHHEFEYDSKGRKTVDSCYNRNGSLREKFEWRHDEKGNVLEERYYDSDNLLYLTREFEYDEKNQKVGMSAFDREGLRINETSYDLSGNVVKSVDYRGGHIHLMEKFEFVENLLKFHFRYNYREGELGYIHRY